MTPRTKPTTSARQWFYLVSGLVAAVVPILVALGVVGPEGGNTWAGVVATVGGLLGAGAATTAGVQVARQRRDGTLADAPADQIIGALNKVIANASTAQLDLERVREHVGRTVEVAPSQGSLASRVLE